LSQLRELGTGAGGGGAGEDAEVIELLEYFDAKEHRSEDRSHPVEEIACQE